MRKFLWDQDIRNLPFQSLFKDQLGPVFSQMTCVQSNEEFTILVLRWNTYPCHMVQLQRQIFGLTLHHFLVYLHTELIILMIMNWTVYALIPSISWRSWIPKWKCHIWPRCRGWIFRGALRITRLKKWVVSLHHCILGWRKWKHWSNHMYYKAWGSELLCEAECLYWWRMENSTYGWGCLVFGTSWKTHASEWHYRDMV